MSRPEERPDQARDADDRETQAEVVAELEEELTVAAAAPGSRRLLRLEELLLARAALARRV